MLPRVEDLLASTEFRACAARLAAHSRLVPLTPGAADALHVSAPRAARSGGGRAGGGPALRGRSVRRAVAGGARRRRVAGGRRRATPPRAPPRSGGRRAAALRTCRPASSAASACVPRPTAGSRSRVRVPSSFGLHARHGLRRRTVHTAAMKRRDAASPPSRSSACSRSCSRSASASCRCSARAQPSEAAGGAAEAGAVALLQGRDALAAAKAAARRLARAPHARSRSAAAASPSRVTPAGPLGARLRARGERRRGRRSAPPRGRKPDERAPRTGGVRLRRAARRRLAAAVASREPSSAPPRFAARALVLGSRAMRCRSRRPSRAGFASASGRPARCSSPGPPPSRRGRRSGRRRPHGSSPACSRAGSPRSRGGGWPGSASAPASSASRGGAGRRRRARGRRRHRPALGRDRRAARRAGSDRPRRAPTAEPPAAHRPGGAGLAERNVPLTVRGPLTAPGRRATALAGWGRLRLPHEVAERGQASILLVGGLVAVVLGALVLGARRARRWAGGGGAAGGRPRRARGRACDARRLLAAVRARVARPRAEPAAPRARPSTSRSAGGGRARRARQRRARRRRGVPGRRLVRARARPRDRPRRLRVAPATRRRTRVEAAAEAELAPPAPSSRRRAAADTTGPLANRQGKRMRPDVARAFDRMERAARADGVALIITSAFRSDAEQARPVRRAPGPEWVAPPGRRCTARHRARPRPARAPTAGWPPTPSASTSSSATRGSPGISATR